MASLCRNCIRFSLKLSPHFYHSFPTHYHCSPRIQLLFKLPSLSVIYASPRFEKSVHNEGRFRFCPNLPTTRTFSASMEQSDTEIAHEFRFFRVYKDGRVEKFETTQKVPASNDPLTGVRSKNVVISSEPAISARVYLPKIRDPTRKLPVLYHVHGGGFCFESAFSARHQKYLTLLAAEADAVIVSVEYGLFPDRPIPACYEDSWAGLRWVAGHANGDGPEPWLNNHADFERVIIGGESAGGNISHTLGVRVGSDGLSGVKVVGMVLVHPYFGGTDDDKMWLYMCPENSGLQDPMLKPAAEDLGRIGCGRVLVFVAEKDHLCGVGKRYYDELKASGWRGSVELVENEGEEHCFHMEDLTTDNAVALVKRFASFVKQD